MTDQPIKWCTDGPSYITPALAHARLAHLTMDELIAKICHPNATHPAIAWGFKALVYRLQQAGVDPALQLKLTFALALLHAVGSPPAPVEPPAIVEPPIEPEQHQVSPLERASARIPRPTDPIDFFIKYRGGEEGELAGEKLVDDIQHSRTTFRQFLLFIHWSNWDKTYERSKGKATDNVELCTVSDLRFLIETYCDYTFKDELPTAHQKLLSGLLVSFHRWHSKHKKDFLHVIEPEGTFT